MAFTFLVEDGTGLAASNSYVSESDADDYHDGRGHTDWDALTTAVKEAALVRATDYIDKRFGRRFRGSKSTKDQALEWPRFEAMDNDGFLFDDVPRQLVKACAEYALITSRQGELAPAPNLPVPDEAVADGAASTTSVVTGEVKKKTEKVGPLTESTEYRSAAESSAAQRDRSSQSAILNDVHVPEYPVADMWIEELLKSIVSRDVRRA